ncbi:MAG TPA: hypothetical protein VFT45_16430 [Longimicrobium sp.]|nr:hypothetical protein [Longimicrobium sp.]
MKAYVITTGALFGLLAIAHVLRMVWEDAGLARDPFYLCITAVAAALCGWSLYVLRRMRGRPA